MKILTVSTFLPPVLGGGESVALELSKRISRHDIEVHLLTTSKRAYSDNIIIHSVPFTKGLEIFYSTFGWFALKKIIEKNKFDIIHSHLIQPWGFVFRNCREKKVITVHGAVYPERGFPNRFFIDSALKTANRIVVPAKWTLKYIKRHYGFQGIYIPNGIDTETFKPNNDRKRDNVILFVGRFLEQKGVRELVEVAKQLKEYEFWFVGEGPLGKMINLPNTKNLGMKTTKQLVDIYNKATICTFPSYFESFPMVGLEALACGKAIVTTKLGFSEMIENGENGILIKSKDVGTLKDKITLLMEDTKLRKKFEKNSRKSVLKFRWNLILEKYLKLYKELIDHE
ncbi:MAG: glycosyltransferase family 4 protein [Candidatus Methanofastidiosia archaeon]